jgi:molybdate transport system substrate-binding protein
VSEARAASLHVFSAGAAKGLVQALADPFETETGVQVVATFDSAGATRAAFANGAGCDVVIQPPAMQDALAARGMVDAGSIAALGGVQTGVAVARGDAAPALADADA